ncbi:MAG TPA: protein kinase [Anaerolineaceae bacterium]|mgnify:CR=1 FL=1|nr:protein kinase [Anaerolineaceae bacterium]HPN52515.1 protein kinase [Anaerolineaceae bacterium]
MTQQAEVLNQRYILQRQLGKGGMAVVYRARDLMLERPIAVKILREEASRDPAFRDLFRQEARAAANLTHPNIVTIHDFGFDHDRLFIVMEYVPGMDLKSYVLQHGRLPIQQAINLLVQACAGVGYAHRAGLVHCDIKPHNMLVTPDLRLKVTDFGISRALSTIHPEEKSEMVWGSPQYFAPEQAAGLAPSPASDVYALGVILYELLTGQLPFTSTDPVELAHLHREAPPPPPRQLNPDIPEALEEIILKVLSKEPSARYRMADQLGRVLQSFGQPAETGPIATVPTGETTRRAPSAASTASTAVTRPPVPAPVKPQTDPSLNIDWGTIGLGLLAVLAVGGLIPFWMFIWFSLTGG